MQIFFNLLLFRLEEGKSMKNLGACRTLSQDVTR